jgi:predicted RNA-binding Zn ribbon-like protein
MYDFDAGDLSLDFANTINWHGSPHPEEMLPNFSSLIDWGEQAQLITADQASQLTAYAVSQPDEASRLHQQAIQLREAIYHIFSKNYAGEPIDPADLRLLNTMVRQALAHRQVTASTGAFQWEWLPEVQGVDRILWPVAFSAAHLLTSENALRVRECEDDRGCGYLFIDQTKNHSRRWCSMDSCGNRAKAKRHYSRVQAAG